jgi:hypothetical protein
LTHTVITYDAAGEEMSVYTTPPGHDPDPRQLVKNALDLKGSTVAKLWEGYPDDIGDRTPLLELRPESP